MMSAAADVTSVPSVVQTVVQKTFAVVADGNGVRINNHEAGALRRLLSARPTHEIVKAALAEVGNQEDYSVYGQNCEEFATRMRFEVGWSAQVQWSFDRVIPICKGHILLMLCQMWTDILWRDDYSWIVMTGPNKGRVSSFCFYFLYLRKGFHCIIQLFVALDLSEVAHSIFVHAEFFFYFATRTLFFESQITRII